jgi:DNA polymerase-3 subunit gamma/tau
LLSDLLNHFRNLLIYQVSGGDLKLLEASEAEAVALAEQCKSVTPEALTRIMEVLAHCEGRFRDAASKKILIEISLLKAIQARHAVDIDAVLEQLRQLRNGAGATAALSAIPTPAPLAAAAPRADAVPAPVAPAPAPAPAPATAEATASNLGSTLAESVPATAPNPPESDAKLEELWALVVEAVGRVSPFTRTYLLEAHPVSLARNIFTIGFDPEFADHLGLVDNSKNRTLIQTKLSELGYAEVSSQFRPGAGAGKQSAPKYGGTEGVAFARARECSGGCADGSRKQASPGKARVGQTGPGGIQERPVDQAGAGNLQGPDRRSSRLTVIYQISTLITVCRALENS